MAPRQLLLLVLAGVVLATAFLNTLPQAKRVSACDRLGFLAMTPPYYDTYFVLAGFDCDRAGLAPEQVCPATSYGFVYPKTFFLLLPTGLSARHTNGVAYVFLASFVAALFAFFQNVTWRQCAYVVALVGSPPVWFALERANVDVPILALLCLASLWLEQRKWGGAALSLVVLAAWLKLYPFAGLASLLPRVSLRAWVLAMAVCAAGILVQWQHLSFVASHVPRRHFFSFGYPVLPMAARAWLEKSGQPWTVPESAETLLWAVAFLAAAALGLRLYRAGCPRIAGLPHAPAFLLGAGMYAFCWFAGANFFYRYLMLFLTLPFLFHAATLPGLRGMARFLLAALLPMFWLSIRHAFTPVREPLALAVASALAAILGVAGMQLLQDRLRRPVAREAP